MTDSVPPDNELREKIARALHGSDWPLSLTKAKGLADALLPLFQSELVAAERRGAERGWEEGGAAMANNRFFVGSTIETLNPYRALSATET